MIAIPGFWDVGPHNPLPVELTWCEFVRTSGGQVLADTVGRNPSFDNADYIFPKAGVVAELKEVQTEFSRSAAFTKGFDRLLRRVMREDPKWRPPLLGGSGKLPPWFGKEYVRLFRPHIARIIKKANRQIRETKSQLGIATPTGVLFLSNDGFTAIGPGVVRSLACNILTHSYSSIDCLVYLTVNRYVEIQGSDVPRLVWVPAYSDRAADSLQVFINELGRAWFQFLEERVGPFTHDGPDFVEHNLLHGSRPIVLP